nr:STM4013/SEN3800 family hydrolase [Hyella patelloides]
MNQIVGKYDILFITLDTLRYDVAQQLFEAGKTPNLAKVLPTTGWKKRHTPGSFTYAAHHAFFAGFLPTPITPGRHPRLFAVKFEGSSTTTEDTYVFNSDNIVSGLAEIGYKTVCIGGVGFFNKLTPLSQVLPNLFQESYWSRELGVTEINSPENQINLAKDILETTSQDKRLFLFINISAFHQPNYFYLNNSKQDTIKSHSAALEYVDSQINKLWDTVKKRSPTFCILCSDHGTAYGENGYIGHRISDETVWTVPYFEGILEG